MELDHIAVAAWKLEEPLEAWKRLGFEVASTETVPGQGVKVAFLELDGGAHVELMEPLAGDSAIRKFLEKRGPGLHHVAFKADVLEERMKQLGREGIEPLSSEPKEGSRGTRVCFFHPKTTGGVLIELVEHPAPVYDPRD
jgi:methylmalonyl-CoA/ethylmalonyl-CoA epimerase